MKTRILLTITTVTLLMSGCADKKLTTDVGKDGKSVGLYGNGTQVYGADTSSNSGPSSSGSSDNVDPYGSGNYGNQNGTYGNDNNPYAGTSNGVKNVYFGVSEYTITADKVPIIHSNAKLLRETMKSGSKVKVGGHCDASGSDEYNYALGLRRAKAAKDALIAKGINASSISLVSMGESSPECSDSMSSDCYAKNRRVEFHVVR